jgi:hypothetical protein
MMKLTDFPQEHAFEHVLSGCWSMKMFKEWMAAVVAEERTSAYTDGYDAGWDEGHCAGVCEMQDHGGYGV